MEDFRGTRTIGKVTWKVERQMLITFLHFCVSRKWISINPAKELKAPRNLKSNEVVPYTLQEESQILAACDQIGGGKYNQSGARYEQLRARAMIMLLRHTALRVSDVCILRKDAVSWDQEKNTWRVFLYTQKTGDPVFLPIPDSLKLALTRCRCRGTLLRTARTIFGTARARAGRWSGSPSGPSQPCSTNRG
jgi:integrase